MASVLRSKNFLFGEAESIGDGIGDGGCGEVGRLVIDWWNDNFGEDSNGYQQQQSVYYYTLCACYAVVSFVALIQLVRIQMRVPEFGWTTQKVFHLMNFIVNGLRAVLFGLYKKVFLLRPQALEIMLLDLPSLLFFSTYTLLVLFWAEIYRQARSLPTDRLRPTYYIVNGIVYSIQIAIWVSIRLSRGHGAIGATRVFMSVISFGAALGFLIYGGRLFFMLRCFPIESRGREKKLYEVGCVTAICVACFLVRCVVVGVSAFEEGVDVDVIDHPVVNFLYYMGAEVVPSALVLCILLKLPPRRVSDQYTPIK